MLVNEHQRFRAINPGLSNPPCVTVGFSGLQNSFDSPTSHAEGTTWTTGSDFLGVSLNVPVIPHQVEAVSPARGVFGASGDGIVTYGGRGFAVPARVEPEVLAYGIGPEGFNRSGGQGGQFAVTLEAVADSNDNTKTSHWRVASATAQADVGSGYSSSGFVVVAVGDSICASAPSITMGVKRGPPKLTATANSAACNCNGFGAEFEIFYTQVGSGDSVTWAVSSIEVLNGGSGYPDNGGLSFSQGIDGFSFFPLPAATFQAERGVITSASVTEPGRSYTDGVPTGTVTVSQAARGAYYKEDRSLPAYTYSQYASQYEITVDDDLESDTFGQVTHGPPQQVEDGPPYECRRGCLASYNGREYVLCTLSFENIEGQAPKRFVDEAVKLCVFSSFGGGGQLQIKLPEDYDNAATGIATVEVVASGSEYAVLGRSEPSPVFSSFPGSGASFSPSLTQTTDSAGRPVWSVEGIEVSGGSGYEDRANVNMNVSSNPNIGGRFAVGRLNTKRIEPDLSAKICSNNGTGASLVVELAATDSDLPVWRVSEITVSGGGSEYVQGTTISLSVDSPSTRTIQAACAYAEVDESGAIVSVTVTDRGQYYRHTGEPHSVSFDIPGTTRGAFFLEDDSLPPIVATVEVRINQNEWLSQGAGAAIVANVDTNPESETFGTIISATVQNAGSGYKLRSGHRQLGVSVKAARLLKTRSDVTLLSNRLPPSTETEFSIAYYSYLDTSSSSIEAHVTAPDCNGLRKAEVIVREPGYDIVDTFRTEENFCARAFVGEGAGTTITLYPADELGGSAYLRLDGDSNDMEVIRYAAPFTEIFPGWSNNCRGRLEDSCEICRTPRGFLGSPFDFDEFDIGDSIPQLFPLPGYCVWDGMGDFPDQNPPPPKYWAVLDDEGTVLSWYRMCGSCPAGFTEQPPFDASILYSRTRCECGDPPGEDANTGFCFWRPADCESGGIEFDKTTCVNPLP